MTIRMSKARAPGSNTAPNPAGRHQLPQPRASGVVCRASTTRRDLLFVGSGGVLLNGQLPQAAVAADTATAAPVAPGQTIPTRTLTPGLDISEVGGLISMPELAAPFLDMSTVSK